MRRLTTIVGLTLWAGSLGLGALMGCGSHDGGTSGTGGGGVGGAGCAEDCAAKAAEECSVWVCNDGSHAAPIGQCVSVQAPDGSPCDTQAMCVESQVCSNGTCGAGMPTTECVSGDGCCPADCTGGVDIDCGSGGLLLMGLTLPDMEGFLGWPEWREALTAVGASWTERNLDAEPFPSLAELRLYEMIFFVPLGTFTVPGERPQALADWLASAGRRRLFVSGRDILYNLDQSQEPGAKNFYQLLGVKAEGHSAGKDFGSLTTTPGDPLVAGLGGGITIGGLFQDYASVTESAGTTSAIYPDDVDQNNGGGFGALVHYESDDYRAVWLGANFHTDLPVAAERAQLVGNVLDYFESP